MSTKYFNFNHETDLTPVEMDDETGRVTFELGGQSETYASMEEFANFYATARNVLPENLKNWTLIEDGDQYAFVLRAGTAGLAPEEIRQLVEGFRAAGMTPSEIGAAVAAASDNTNATSTKTEKDEKDELLEAVEDTFNNLDDLSRRVLINYVSNGDNYNDDKTIDALIEDDEFIDDVKDATQPNTDEYQGEYDDDEDEYDTFTVSEAVENIIDNYISGYINELEEQYNVPVQIALDTKNNSTVNDEDAYETLKHANFAAKVAKRDLFVKYAKPETESFTNEVETYTVENYVFAPIFEGKIENGELTVYNINSRFYLVENVDE